MYQFYAYICYSLAPFCKYEGGRIFSVVSSTLFKSSFFFFILFISFSDFEELEAVPTLTVMDGPLEPSSTTSNAADIPDDRSFVNFFSVRFLYSLNI